MDRITKAKNRAAVPNRMEFELDSPPPARKNRLRLGSRRRFASASAALSESVLSKAPPVAPPPGPSHPTVDPKPASDVIAGAVARAASQSTIHPLDTLKVRMQSAGPAGARRAAAVSKFGRLVPPAGAKASVKRALPAIASLYKGVIGAASGAGIYIGAYFGFYGAACNLLARHTSLTPGGVAFVAGGVAAAGGSVVKVPLAVCIRSVQAGVYPNAFCAASSIVEAVGVRGLFTGYLPTLLEDVPDMAFKFAAYETLRGLHRSLTRGRPATVQEDFAIGAVSGAFAAAATTPLDVIKTTMMCAAAQRPSMLSASRTVWAQGGAAHFFRGIGPRAVSNGINSAVFFCFFEALRATFAKRKAQAAKREEEARKLAAARAARGAKLLLCSAKAARLTAGAQSGGERGSSAVAPAFAYIAPHTILPAR